MYIHIVIVIVSLSVLYTIHSESPSIVTKYSMEILEMEPEP